MHALFATTPKVTVPSRINGSSPGLLMHPLFHSKLLTFCVTMVRHSRYCAGNPALIIRKFPSTQPAKHGHYRNVKHA